MFPQEPGTGRFLRQIFMELPSRKDYPDYYQVILEPIDMTMIEGKIKAEKVSHKLKFNIDWGVMVLTTGSSNQIT